MDFKKNARLLSAALVFVMLFALCFTAVGESGNPFMDPSSPNGNVNPFVNTPSQDASPSPTPTSAPLPAVTPIPTAVPVTATGDTFNLGAADNGVIGTQSGANPFGTGSDAANPFGASAQVSPTSVPGYNPFDPNSSPTAAAPAPTAMTMFVTASTVKIRREARENAGTLATASFGQQLQVTATQGDWVQIANVKNRTGYCMMKDLSSTDPNTMAKTMYAQFNRLPFYRTPDRHAGKLRWLNQGDTVTVTAITSDGLWSRATDGKDYGFIPTIYLDDAPAGQGTPMWCAEGSTAVLVNPDNWTEITKLSLGQQVILAGYVENNTIAKIRSDKGYVAYCAASALSTADPASLNISVYPQVGGKILFRSADLNGKNVGIGKNARLTLLGLDNAQFWALVKYNGRKYYTPYVLVGPARLGNNGYRVVVTTQDTTLYRNPNETLGVLPANTRLYLNGFTGTTAQVTTVSDGVNPQSTGYVALTDIRGE